jgi:hypothetical protein
VDGVPNAPKLEQVAHVRRSLVDGAVEESDIEQVIQDADPEKFLNVPAAHNAHGPLSGPVKPALQVHKLDKFPALLKEFSLHPTQT